MLASVRPGDLLVDEHHLFLGLGGLDEDDVRAGFLVSKAALDGLFDAVNGTGVGTGHDHHVALAGINGGLDLADHLFHGNDLTAGHVAALLGHDLVLELNDGDAGLLILADGALHVDSVAEAGVGVGDDEGVAAASTVLEARMTISLMVIRPTSGWPRWEALWP